MRVVFSALLLLGTTLVSHAEVQKTRTFQLTYEFTITGLKPGAETRLWVPIPADSAAQKVLREGDLLAIFPEGGLTLDDLGIGFQRMNLFLQSQILVHEIFYLASKSDVLISFGPNVGERSEIDRNAYHDKDRNNDQEREPPWSRATIGCGGNASISRWCGPFCRRSAGAIPINICGLAQVSSPDRRSFRSLRKSLPSVPCPTASSASVAIR